MDAAESAILVDNSASSAVQHMSAWPGYSSGNFRAAVDAKIRNCAGGGRAPTLNLPLLQRSTVAPESD